jgi:hypothetical protein
MMRIDNKVEPISTIDTKSKSDYLDEFEEFASNPESQINQKKKISQPIEDQSNEAFKDATPSKQAEFAEERQKNEISSLHYFSWLSDIFLSIGVMAVWGIVPTHNMLEEPSYW